jgi:hypothetical protein
MTELSQPEIDAAKNIGLMLSDLPVDRVSFAYKHAVKIMIARLLQKDGICARPAITRWLLAIWLLPKSPPCDNRPRCTDADTRRLQGRPTPLDGRP